MGHSILTKSVARAAYIESVKVTDTKWDLSSAGRASALQAEGHRFEPYRSHFLSLLIKGAECRRGGTGRRTGLKILRD